jgi:hypothetical protein
MPIGAPTTMPISATVVFATNFGVISVPVAQPLTLAALAVGVLVAANLLAAVPALAASRSYPGQLLRSE